MSVDLTLDQLTLLVLFLAAATVILTSWLEWRVLQADRRIAALEAELAQLVGAAPSAR